MHTPKMLTITQTAKAFGLPKNFIRQAVLDGRIVHVKAGKKHLINVQKVEEWLNAGDTPHAPAESRNVGGGSQITNGMGD